MKERVIQSILNGMTRVLGQDQLEALRRTLDVELYEYTLEKQQTALSTVTEDENIMLVRNYLVSKKIEGCSDQTLKAYGEAIKRMLREINKNIKDIDTNDIRYYLGSYQINKGVSKVTIDNNRRNINGFFTWLEQEEYIISRADDMQALFVADRRPYKSLKKTGFDYILKQIGKRAGVANVHAHRFRRTAATIALNRGMLIEQVQLMLGHTSINTTLGYAMVNARNVKLAHEKYLS